MRKLISPLIMLALCFVVAGPVSATSFIAYNDCAGAASGSHANATYFRTHNDPNADWFGKNPYGELKDITTGLGIDVYVTMESSNISPWGTQAFPGGPGTDAYNIFNGYVDLDEVASYWLGNYNGYYQATFTGLDPSMTYEFVTTINRDGSSYAGTGASSRWTKFSIIGADTYTNASSAGILVVSQDVLKMNVYNTINGYIIRWTGITALDGSFTIRSENVGLEGPGSWDKFYGMEAFKLTGDTGAPIPEPGTFLLLGTGLLGIAAIRYRRSKK